jgi:hypothetical protein
VPSTLPIIVSNHFNPNLGQVNCFLHQRDKR